LIGRKSLCSFPVVSFVNVDGNIANIKSDVTITFIVKNTKQIPLDTALLCVGLTVLKLVTPKSNCEERQIEYRCNGPD